MNRSIVTAAPGERGPASVHVAALDFTRGFAPQVAAHVLAEHGVVILRGVLDAATVRDLGERTRTAFTDLDRTRCDLPASDRRSLDRMEMPVPDERGASRMRLAHYQVLDAPALAATIECVAGPFVWHVPPQVRRQHPDVPDALLPYYQAAAYTRHYREFVVCWTPLTPCGVDAPGIEVVVGRVPYGPQHGGGGPRNGATPLQQVAPQELAGIAAGMPTVAPALEPGDVVLLDHTTLYRTYLPAGVCRTRYSIDFRAAPLRAIPEPVRRTRRFVDPRELAYV